MTDLDGAGPCERGAELGITATTARTVTAPPVRAAGGCAEPPTDEDSAPATSPSGVPQADAQPNDDHTILGEDGKPNHPQGRST